SRPWSSISTLVSAGGASGIWSSSATITWPPPRLSAARWRACSTMIQRIALAEAAKKWLRSASASGEPWVMRRNNSCTSTVGVNVDSLPYMRELARRRSSGYSASNTTPSCAGSPSRASASNLVISVSDTPRSPRPFSPSLGTNASSRHARGQSAARGRRVWRVNASARGRLRVQERRRPHDARLFEPGIAHRLQRGDVRRGAREFDLRAQLRGDFLFHRHLVLVEQALVGADRLVATAQAQVGVAQFHAGVDLLRQLRDHFLQPIRHQRPVAA